MTIEKVRSLRLAEPFKPFSIVTRGGESLPVEYPRWLAIAPNGRRLAYSPPTGGLRFIPADEVVDAVLDEKLSTSWRPAK